MTCLSTFGVPACINGTASVTAVFGVDRQGDASVHYLDKNGAPVAVIPSDTVTFGGCSAQPVDVLAGSLGIIAGATRSATPAFAGAAASVSSASIAGKVQSITVTAKGVTDGTVGANAVTVTLPSGVAMRLFNNQTFTWSVTRGIDDELVKPVVVTASGNAYANVGYTTV